MFKTVIWMNFCEAIPSSLQGIAVFATQRASVPLGPPGPSRVMHGPEYPVKACDVRGVALSKQHGQLERYSEHMSPAPHQSEAIMVEEIRGIRTVTGFF